MFLDVNLPFNLIVTAKTSAPEQFERPPSAILKAMLKAIAWRNRAQDAQIEDNITKCRMVRAVAVQTELPEILKEG